MQIYKLNKNSQRGWKPETENGDEDRSKVNLRISC
jgi:hypothetical protein